MRKNVCLTMIEVTTRNGAAVFSVRIVPRASRDSIGGELQGALKAHVTAPPVGGPRERGAAAQFGGAFECTRLGC
ncbi:MAG: DUF167 domain-containing protein [Candidatus Acidiferrales bacterium]